MNEIEVGDIVEVSGERVTVDSIDSHEGQTYVTFLNPNPCQIRNCNCDPYRTAHVSTVRRVMNG